MQTRAKWGTRIQDSPLARDENKDPPHHSSMDGTRYLAQSNQEAFSERKTTVVHLTQHCRSLPVTYLLLQVQSFCLLINIASMSVLVSRTPLQRTSTSTWEVPEHTAAPSLREKVCFPLRHARLFPDLRRVRESHRLLSPNSARAMRRAKTCTLGLPAATWSRHVVLFSPRMLLRLSWQRRCGSSSSTRSTPLRLPTS